MRYRSVDVRAFDAGTARLVTDCRKGRVVEMSHQAFEVLRSCVGVRELAEHALAIAAQRQLSVPDVMSILGSMVLSGFLEPAPDTTDSSLEVAEITTVVVTTAGRPASCQATVSVLVDLARVFAWRCRLLVVDGSTAEVAERTKQSLRRLAGASPIPIHYLYARDLSGRTGSDPKSVALRATSGELTLFVSDSLEGFGADTSERARGVRIAGHHDIQRVRYFDAAPQARQALATGPVDVVAEHRQLLGQSLDSLWSGALGPVDASEACAHIVPGSRGRVLVTSSGAVGTKAASPLAPFVVSPRQSSEWLRSETEMMRASTGTVFLRQANSLAVTHGPMCFPECCGLDNRVGLPTFPTAFDDARVFPALVSYLWPAGLFGFLPHVARMDLDVPLLVPQELLETRVGDLVLGALQECARHTHADEPRERLMAFACHLRAIAFLGDDSLQAWVVETRVSQVAARARQVSLACQGAPESLRHAAGQLVRTLLATASSPGFSSPTDCSPAGSCDATSPLRRCLAAYADELDEHAAQAPDSHVGRDASLQL